MIKHVFKAIQVLSIIITLVFLLQTCTSKSVRVLPPKSPEELVYVQTIDHIIDGGSMITPTNSSLNTVAIIWIHGWGANFYYPSYINIARSLANQGYTCLSVNTRMHDLGNVEGYIGDKRIRGGGYWGVASDEVKDISAWINLAETYGYKQVILVGHSAGWSPVRRYQAEKQDKRVIGLVCASGSISPDTRQVDSAQLIQAIPLIAADKGDELIKDPKRSFPSYISAATFMDIVNAPPEYKDFFGFNTPNAGITKIHCPILAFFGTHNDVGNEAELESLVSCIKKQPDIQIKVTTTMIKNADHMYTGEENQVAQIIAKWIQTI